MDPSPLRIHALGLIGMGAITSIMMTTPVIGLYLSSLGLPAAHIGAIIGTMSLALVGSEVALAVAASSRLGRRGSVAVAITGSAVMLGWFPLTGSLLGLYLNRFAFGAVRGLLWPVLFAEVADAAHPQRQGTSFALFWLYFGVGNLIGPALGGLLGERFSLLTPFYAAAAISLLTVPLLRVLRTQRDTGARNPLAGYPLLLHAPRLLRAWGLTLCNVIVFSLYLTFLPLHAAAQGLSTAQIGVIFTAGAVAFILGQAALRRADARFPAERLLVVAFIARGASAATVPWLHSMGALLTANFITSVLTAAISPALSTRIAAQAPRDHLVAAMGGFNASADLGFFIGPLAGGVLATLGLQWAFWLAVPVTAAALWLLTPSAQVNRRSATIAPNSRPK